jgi:hypothetical protein
MQCNDCIARIALVACKDRNDCNGARQDVSQFRMIFP